MLTHLLQRRCNPQNYTTVHYDNNCAAFMLYTLTGVLQGYQVYTPNLPKNKGNNPREQRYFTYSPKLTATPWGSRHTTHSARYALWRVCSMLAPYMMQVTRQ